MKFYLFLIVSLLSAPLISYCQTSNITRGCAPLTVNFTAPTSSTSYFWDFKDQATSTLQNPSNTFLSSGVYNVEFRESVGGPVINTIIITVLDKPVPTFSTDINSGCVPLTVSFTNTTAIDPSISITNFSWVFGDGATASGSNTNHTFTQTGNFYVSLDLTTSLPSCNATKQNNNLINASAKPDVSFTTNPNPPVSCTVPLTVGVNNLSSSSAPPLTYQWDFGNGQTSTSASPPPVTYTAENNYPLKLTVTDGNNCSDSLIKYVSVGKPVPILEYPDTFCLNFSDTIFNNSSGGSSWNFGPNSVVQGFYLGLHPIVKFTTPGFQSVTLNLTTPGCNTDTVIRIFVEEIIADFTIDPTYTCENPSLVNYSSTTPNAARYDWIFYYDNLHGTGKDTSRLYTDSNRNAYHINRKEILETGLIVTSASGCKDNIRKFDTIFRPTALMIPDVTRGCVPLSVTFSDSSLTGEKSTITQWEWFFGDGSSIVSSDGSPQTHAYTATGRYLAYLVITNSSGCIDTSYLTPIQVGDNITPDFSVDVNEICIGEEITLTDITNSPIKDSIDTWHYTGEEGRMFNCFQNSNSSWKFNNEVGPQSITMTVGFNGCYTSVTKNNIVNVKGAVAQLDYKLFCNDPYNITFIDSSKNATSLEWDLDDGNTSTASNFTHNYLNKGDYNVVLKAENIASGCPPTYDTSTVYIREIKANFTIDSLICDSVPEPIDASNSVDVYASCYRGYNFRFSDPLMKPYTTADSVAQILFPSTGNVDIQLIVNDINGCRDTAYASTKVYGINANFSMSDNSICFPATVDFSSNSSSDTTITKWIWNFAEIPYPDSSLQFLSYTIDSFPLRGQSSSHVSLQVIDELGCTEVIRRTISRYKVNSYVSILSDSNICAGETVDFEATDFTDQGSNLTFNWNFDDGTSSTLQSPSHTFTSEKEFNVKLLYQEVSSGCIDSTFKTISVKDKPIAGFFTSADTALIKCPDKNLLFTDTSISSFIPLLYEWDFGNGQTSTFKDPGTVYSENGDYTIRQIVRLGEPYGCSDTLFKTIKVKGPQGNFVTDLGEDTICRLESVLFTLTDTSDVDFYKWDFGDGTSLTNTSPVSHQYTFVPPSGKTLAKLILSNIDGSCAISRETEINIYEVIADFERNNGMDTAICFAPYPITNLSTNADQWNWNFGDGTTSTKRNPGILNYAQPGTYSVLLSISNSSLQCNDTIIKDIILHPIPEISTFSDTICEGDTSVLRVTNPNSFWDYLWISQPPSSIKDSNRATIRVSPALTTTYLTRVIDTNNCRNADTSLLTVINPLDLKDFDTSIVIGDSIDLPVYVDAGLYNFIWTGEEGLSCLDCSPPRIQPLEDIRYNLMLSDVIGCFTYDADFDITVNPETFIKLPTSFTPNGDGVNDVISVKGWGIKELLEFKIFNRWGELVFETSDIDEGWDGSYKGKIQNNDVYVYQVRAKTWRDEEKTAEGYINLIR